MLAVVLTYWSVGLAYTPLVIQASRDADKADASSGAVAGNRSEAPDGTGSPEDSSFVGTMAYLFAFTFVLPVLVVVGSLPSGAISALIIGFGMHKAWQMTSVPHLQILGPFQIAAPAAPVG